jgi:hypothetical protein
MHANQWEAREIMIEKDIIMPTFFVVTVIAVFALLAPMYIVFPVTSNAVGF